MAVYEVSLNSEQAYPFVIVDALVIKERRDEAVRSTSGLIVSGVNEAGERELLGLRLGDSESEGTWSDMFAWLKRRGARGVELAAIAGSLSLLANIVMAWITQRIQQVLDTRQHAGARRVEPEVLRHIAPVHFQDINFRGVMQFPMVRYRGRLIRGSTR
jgi:hypothetical protein